MTVQSITDWALTGFYPYTAIQGNSMELGQTLQGCTPTIPAKVPGSVYMDLYRAGLIDDPYYERNSLKCEWVANRWWIYAAEPEIPTAFRGRRIRLVFRGIDYKAHIYFNQMAPVVHEGMYTPCIIDITDHVHWGQKNVLHVVIEHAPDEMGQIGYTSRTHTQKARFNYKWDFGTRLVNLGLYDTVTIEATGESRILSQHVRYADGGILTCAADVEGGGTLSAELSFHDTVEATASAAVTDGHGMLTMQIAHPRLWYPSGSGTQPLYDLKITFTDLAGQFSDEKTLRTGLRTLSYERCDCAPANSLPYLVSVNGRRIYIKGVNMTPLDHMYGCVTRDRYAQLLRLAHDANVNLIRVWGGGLIEKEEFYDLCDEYGIMVWQEFIQSSSGIDNVPSKKPEFLRLCALTAEHAVREKRNHVSLTFWSGGNELMDAYGVPSTYEDANIAMLKQITGTLDPDRLMLPTSASGPLEFLDNARPADNHDVHGPWKYGGIVDHYTLYNHAASQLHSEFGCDGMSNITAIRQVLAPENQKVTTVAENLSWRHRGEWWDTYASRDHALFGEIADLDTLIAVSQLMQAEGIRYALEANRRRQWRNCGSIVWQLNEPWPNVSCTCIVDYYAQPKLAYYFYRDAMQPFHISLAYEKLAYCPGDTFRFSPFIHDDDAKIQEQYDIAIILQNAAREPLISFTEAGEWCVPPDAGTVFFADCTVHSRTSPAKFAHSLYLFFVHANATAPLDASAAVQFYNSYMNQALTN